jgi:DNA-binding response OmpR family regulator
MARILIIDDDKQATNLLEKVMRLERFDTVGVNDSRLTIQVIDSFKPDLIILDLMMPYLNGFQLCNILQSDPRYLHIPIIIVTAMDDSDSKSRAMSAGAKDYFTKPFMPDELSMRVKTLIFKNVTPEK